MFLPYRVIQLKRNAGDGTHRMCIHHPPKVDGNLSSWECYRDYERNRNDGVKHLRV